MTVTVVKQNMTTERARHYSLDVKEASGQVILTLTNLRAKNTESFAITKRDWQKLKESL